MIELLKEICIMWTGFWWSIFVCGLEFRKVKKGRTYSRWRDFMIKKLFPEWKFYRYTQNFFSVSYSSIENNVICLCLETEHYIFYKFVSERSTQRSTQELLLDVMENFFVRFYAEKFGKVRVKVFVPYILYLGMYSPRVEPHLLGRVGINFDWLIRSTSEVRLVPAIIFNELCEKLPDDIKKKEYFPFLEARPSKLFRESLTLTEEAFEYFSALASLIKDDYPELASALWQFINDPKFFVEEVKLRKKLEGLKFTDLIGEFPQPTQVHVPVLWVKVGNSRKSPPFGEVVELDGK